MHLRNFEKKKYVFVSVSSSGIGTFVKKIKGMDQVEFARDIKNTLRHPGNPIKIHILDGGKKKRKTACISRLVAPGGMSNRADATMCCWAV